MHDRTFNGSTLLATALWVSATGLLAAAWILAAAHPAALVMIGMLAATGLAICMGAAVAQTRIYTLRVCALIRLTSGLVPDGDGERVTPPVQLRTLR